MVTIDDGTPLPAGACGPGASGPAAPQAVCGVPLGFRLDAQHQPTNI